MDYDKVLGLHQKSEICVVVHRKLHDCTVVALHESLTLAMT
jgi:hypothetical protein